ncbi:MAG: hypothetical protein GW823_05820 [Bacteroidetes bacterium]|nr:hypothetical protein [Bacteroidota bacterium]
MKFLFSFLFLPHFFGSFAFAQPTFNNPPNAVSYMSVVDNHLWYLHNNQWFVFDLQEKEDVSEKNKSYLNEVRQPYGKHNELLFISKSNIVHIKGAKIFKDILPDSLVGAEFANEYLYLGKPDIGIRYLGDSTYHFSVIRLLNFIDESSKMRKSSFFNCIWSNGKELEFSEFYKNIQNMEDIVPVYRSGFPLFVLQNWAIWKQTDSGFKPFNLDGLRGFRELKMADIDSEGNLWVYQNDVGLIKVDTTDHVEQIRFKLKSKFIVKRANYFAITENDGIVFGNEQELIHYKNGDFVKIKEFSTPKIFSLATWKNSVIIGSDEGFEIVE